MNAHPATVRSLHQAVSALWPEALAEEWDRVGLLVGHPEAPVRKVLLVVDITPETCSEAVALGADAILAHHPLLLRGVTSVAENTLKGALIAQLTRAHIGVIAAHTNADAPSHGVADALAQALTIQDARPIAPSPNQSSPHDAVAGIGRVGNLQTPMSLVALAQQLAGLLPATVSGVRVAGDPEQVVRTVALCPGAGDSLLDNTLVCEADVYITSDLRHHPARDTSDLRELALNAPALIDVSHWACESLWLNTAAEQLASALPDVDFCVSSIRTDPWDFSVGAQVTPGREEMA